MYIIKNYNEKQITLLIYKNHYCLITNLQNFCKKIKMYTHLDIKAHVEDV